MSGLPRIMLHTCCPAAIPLRKCLVLGRIPSVSTSDRPKASAGAVKPGPMLSKRALHHPNFAIWLSLGKSSCRSQPSMKIRFAGRRIKSTHMKHSVMAAVITSGEIRTSCDVHIIAIREKTLRDCA